MIKLFPIIFLDIAAGYVPLCQCSVLFCMFSVLSGRGLGANGACLQLQNYVCLTGTNTKLELLYIQILHDVTRLLCTFFPFRIFETKSTWKHMPDRLSAPPFNRNSPKAFQVSTARPSQYLGRMVSCTFYFIPLYLRVDLLGVR